MSPSNTTPASPFKTLRIIGERAQRLLAKARDIRSKATAEHSGLRKPSRESLPEIRIHLSLRGTMSATIAIAAIAVGVVLLYALRETIVLLFLGCFVAVIADPGIKACRRIGIPRGIAILLQYFIAIFLIAFLFVSLFPIIAEQLQQLAQFIQFQVNSFLLAPQVNLPLLPEAINLRMTSLIQTTLQDLSATQFTATLQHLGQSLSGAAEGSLLYAAHLAGNVLNFFVQFIIVLVLGFFIQLEKEKTIAWSRSFLNPGIRAYVDEKADRVHWKLSQWARGQLLLSGSAFVLVYLALLVMRMDYALTLAVFAAFTELIPVIGIFVAAVPAVLIGLTTHGLLWGALLVCIYYVIHWCEGNLILPLVLERSVGLSPIAIIVAMLVGISFPSIIHPMLGIVIAIPAAATLSVFFEDWQEKRKGQRS